MDTTNAPQLIEHLSKSISFTPFDTKWIPQTAKFIVGGETPKRGGIIQIYQLNKTELTMTKEFSLDKGVKCLNFGLGDNLLSIGDFDGNLTVLDFEKFKPAFNVKAHSSIINGLDAIGGASTDFGAAEIVTGSRDGSVRVWDPRTTAPVLSLEPVEKDPCPEAWCVGFGNSFADDERMIMAGYDNGDVKLFNMKSNMLEWETNLQNGVCGLEFDRKDILMNKAVATTLEGKFHLFDLRTFNSVDGYTGLAEKTNAGTIWGIKHIPQNRDLFMIQGGNGHGSLYKYNYPPQRAIETSEGRKRGVVGSVELLNEKEFSTQPISSFAWSKEKLGLGAFTTLDQNIRVLIATKLNLY